MYSDPSGFAATQSLNDCNPKNGGEKDSKSGRSATFYKNNPMDNPKAARDIIENPNAVYGFSPNPESTRIGKYANKIDWTNPEQVAIARQTRKAYQSGRKTTADIYSFGNKSAPRGARPKQDFDVENFDSIVGPEMVHYQREHLMY